VEVKGFASCLYALAFPLVSELKKWGFNNAFGWINFSMLVYFTPTFAHKAVIKEGKENPTFGIFIQCNMDN